MPARVHAILVVRPEGRTPAALHLRRTLAALSAQTRRIDVLTIVLCGADAALTEIAASSGAEGVITASRGTGFAAATALATPRLQGDAVWLLAQDTAPEADALTQLAGALELSPSLAFVAPKLVGWDDRSAIVSLGASMTTFGETVDLAAGELDQGQNDTAADVLGADVRGLLVRREAWRVLGGLDPALAGGDEGLDLGVRARLAGERVAVVPAARVAVSGDGVAGLPSGRRASRREFSVRTAQLHRRLTYAPAAAVPLHWISLAPLAVWRTIAHLLAKEPGRVGAEWAATFLVLVRLGSVARARSRIRATRQVGWQRLAPLRIGRAERRLRLDDPGSDPDAPVRSDLRFFSGGGAWAVLGALVVSVASFPALLAWPVLGGGALAPLRATVTQLWTDAAYGQRALGLDEIGPADPFSAVVAIVGTLWPLEPSRALVVLWILALPLAVLGGWFASTRVTERSALRLTGAIAWGLAPTFLAALSEGRTAAVLVHLLLPWLLYTASVAHRSWAAAGGASLLFLAVVACAPSLAPALVLLWIGSLTLVAVARHGRGVARVVWLVVPTVVFAAPLVWHQLRSANPWGLLADPGVAFAGDVVGSESAARSLLVAGFPTADAGGWAQMAPGMPLWWVPLLVAPLAVAALLSVLTPRWITGAVLLVVAGTGLVTACAAPGIAVAFAGAAAVPVWPGGGLSLAWAGVIGGALVALDVGLPSRTRVVRPLVALVILGALAVTAVPTLTATLRGTFALTNGPESTLPAYVAAEGRGDPRLGTIVLDPRAEGMEVDVVWGGSETLGGQSTIVATRTRADASDSAVAELAVDLASTTADDVVDVLASRGIGFVLLAAEPGGDPDAVRALRLAAATALDQRVGLDAVGETTRGSLWRVTGEVQPRADAGSAVDDTARLILLAQVVVVLIALLLAVPTATSRRVARRTPRIVGPAPGGMQ